MDLTSLIKITQPFWGLLGAISLLTFIVSLMLIPFIVGKLPVDIFIKLNTKPKSFPPASGRGLLLLFLRNAVAVLLLLGGFIMLFIPGQGLLTIVIGLLLLSFPGKQKIVIYLIKKQTIRKSLDWIRVKQNHPPFCWPD